VDGDIEATIDLLGMLVEAGAGIIRCPGIFLAKHSGSIRSAWHPSLTTYTGIKSDDSDYKRLHSSPVAISDIVCNTTYSPTMWWVEIMYKNGV
jgi:hypothetical protein